MVLEHLRNFVKHSNNVGIDARESIHTDVPPEVKELIKEQDGYQWETISHAVMQTYGGEALNSIPALEREKDRIRREKRNLKEEIDERMNEIDRLEQKEQQVDARIEKLEDERESYEDELDALLNDMEERGTHAYVGSPRIEDIAKRHRGGRRNEMQEQVVSELKDRADERDLDIPPEQFEEFEANRDDW